MGGRTVRKKCAGGANPILYSPKFVTSEIIVYVMPGDKNKSRISKNLSAAQKKYI